MAKTFSQVEQEVLARYREGVWNRLRWWLSPSWRRLARLDAAMQAHTYTVVRLWRMIRRGDGGGL